LSDVNLQVLKSLIDEAIKQARNQAHANANKQAEQKKGGRLL